jgi:hypothetical protein
MVGDRFRFFFGDWIGKQPDIDELERGPGAVIWADVLLAGQGSQLSGYRAMGYGVELHMCGGTSGSARSTEPEQPGQRGDWDHDEFAGIELECTIDRYDAVHLRGMVGGGFWFLVGDRVGERADIDELERGPGVVV